MQSIVCVKVPKHPKVLEFERSLIVPCKNGKEQSDLVFSKSKGWTKKEVKKIRGQKIVANAFSCDEVQGVVHYAQGPSLALNQKGH